MATATEIPVRAGIYGSVPAAKDAVRALKRAGFSTDQISVVCSEKHAEEHFGVRLLDQKPAGEHSNQALNSAAVAELGLGAAAVLSIVLSGGAAIVAAGALAGLGIAGTLASLFATRGTEKEVADFFDQELQGGDLLVAVEVHGDDAAQWLAHAEDVFRQTGAKPIPLPEG